LSLAKLKYGAAKLFPPLSKLKYTAPKLCLLHEKLNQEPAKLGLPLKKLNYAPPKSFRGGLVEFRGVSGRVGQAPRTFGGSPRSLGDGGAWVEGIR